MKLKLPTGSLHFFLKDANLGGKDHLQRHQFPPAAAEEDLSRTASPEPTARGRENPGNGVGTKMSSWLR